MDALATIIGLGLASFMLFFFSSQLEEKHGLLKLLSLFFVLALIILIPKTIIDNQETCDYVLADTYETYIYGANYTDYHADYDYNPLPSQNALNLFHRNTTYNYVELCLTDNKATNGTFYKAILWFFRLFMAYVLLYLGWESLQALMNSYKTRGRR